MSSDTVVIANRLMSAMPSAHEGLMVLEDTLAFGFVALPPEGSEEQTEAAVKRLVELDWTPGTELGFTVFRGEVEQLLQEPIEGHPPSQEPDEVLLITVKLPVAPNALPPAAMNRVYAFQERAHESLLAAGMAHRPLKAEECVLLGRESLPSMRVH